VLASIGGKPVLVEVIRTIGDQATGGDEEDAIRIEPAHMRR
jgi:hypothetical protein